MEAFVEPNEDFHDELLHLRQALSKQQSALETAQATREAWQDQATELMHLLKAAEARAAQLEKRLLGGSSSRASEALEALRESGHTGAAALVVVLARLCGGPRLAFLAIDANNSGAVSTYEFDSALRMRLGLDYEAITGLKLRSLFKEFDTRHCGLVYGVDMVSAFAEIWRSYGIPEEIARDPLLNPDLGAVHDDVLREQQRWLMEAFRLPRSSPRRARSSSPESSRTPRGLSPSPTSTRGTPRGGSSGVNPPDVIIRDEWQRGYHTVGIPLSPRSLARAHAAPAAPAPVVTLPGVSARSHAESRTARRAKPKSLAALANAKQQMRELSPNGAGPPQSRISEDHLEPDFRRTGALSPSPNRAGAMVDSQQAQQAARQKLPSRLGEHEPERTKPVPPPSPNRAGAMVDSQQAVARQQKMQSRQIAQSLNAAQHRDHPESPHRAAAAAGLPPQTSRSRISKETMLQAGPKHTDVSVGQDADSEQASRRSRDEVEEVKSRLSTGSRGGAGAMADSEQAASRQQSLRRSRDEVEQVQSRVSTGSTASTTDRLTSATAPSGGPAGAEEAASAASRPLRRSREEVQVESLNTAGAMTEILPGHTRSKAKEDARERRSSAVSEIPPEDLELFDSRREPERRSDRPAPRVEPGGSGPMPSPEVMAKAANARSLLFVSPEGSVSSTLGVSKTRKVKSLSMEELARRDSSPPSFLCGRSFGRSEEVLLPLRPKDRHTPQNSPRHSPSPTSDRALQALMRGEEPQLLWAASPDLKPKRSSQFSFGGGHDEDQDRSTTSKSPGKSGTDRSSRPRALTASNSRSPSSRSPRSAVSPRSMGRSASPYSNRAIYVADTPWSHPPQSVPTKAWR
ncbi:unnamed protein product [Durusdinium trenchii]|uniref:EF-hand domain-containing protein n=1 Tax=Durusdinium trenchii TaxID=1381693 RepID=A0ABP0NUS5_9DINO